MINVWINDVEWENYVCAHVPFGSTATYLHLWAYKVWICLYDLKWSTFHLRQKEGIFQKCPGHKRQNKQENLTDLEDKNIFVLDNKFNQQNLTVCALKLLSR
jgi:hypothetical protein